MRILVVEDAQYRIRTFRSELVGHNVCVATGVQEAIVALSGEPFDAMFLDHDLGDQAYLASEHPETVCEVVRRVGIGPFQSAQTVVIHSLNPVGARNLAAMLGRPCEVTPFHAIDWDAVRSVLDKG